MTRSSPSRSSSNDGSSSSSQWVLPMVQLGMAVALFAVHVQTADAVNSASASASASSSNNTTQPVVTDFLTRFTSGPEHLTTLDMIAFMALGVIAMEVVNCIAYQTGVWVKFDAVPVRGKHLDALSSKDLLFIGISKAQTGPFVYFLLRYALSEPNVVWMPEDLSWQTVLLPIPFLFLVFDFFYTALHWALHIKAIYGYIHKHHHTQKAPSRANEDAINVHPLEYVLGEYNHLWAFFLCCRVFGLKIHMAGALLFLSMGGVMAGWNHTRYDITVPILGWKMYDSKAHDVHHRIPQSNYGQYTMFWDYVFGTYRPYDPTDRVNPKAQLDPKTGKSYEYAAAAKSQ